MKTKWSEKDIEFLKENYPRKGKDFCSKVLGRSGSSVFKKANRLGITVDKDVKSINNKVAQIKHQNDRSNDDFNVNIEQFISIKKPEIAYLLGFLWADGYITRNEIRLEIVKKDMTDIKKVLDSIGTWTYSDRQRKNWQVVTRATTSNKKLMLFLKENDYDKKSYVSADKILSKIPDELKHYWFRGLIDGDGNIYPPKKRISISGSYDQNWFFIIDLCSMMDANCNIYKIDKINKSSVIEINGTNGCKFGEFIYSGLIFGLSRKYKKYLEMKNGAINPVLLS
jgi:hypothetical protein